VFYDKCESLANGLLLKGIVFCFQWLPPYAWYFGGSKIITVFNQEKGCHEESKRTLPVCLDTSYLILGANFFRFDSRKKISKFEDNNVDIHISDTVGVDGEGIQFGSSPKYNSDLILSLLYKDVAKVLEIWQGYSNKLSGIRESLIN
jgi:hypothetical protein